MIPLSLLLGFAQQAPALMQFFGAGKKSTAVAEKVIDIAKVVTGATTGESALSLIENDPTKRYEFQKAVLTKTAELEIAYLNDVESARKRDAIFTELGKRNYRADLMFFMAVAVIGILCWAIWTTPDIEEWKKGIATLILGRFLGYLDNIYNFEFGSTRSSKTKDSTIEKLTKEQQ